MNNRFPGRNEGNIPPLPKRKRLADLSAESIGSTPAQMAAFMKKDAERWRGVIRSAGVKAD